jgi:hypothetical protein
MVTENKRLFAISLSVGLLLMVPLIAMQFTKEVEWGMGDFLVMGMLLLGAGFMCEFVLRKVKSKKQRFFLCVAIFAGFLLVWLELAVGIFRTPFAGS